MVNDTIPLIFVLYDGIENSVFYGQVLQPLLDIHHKNPQQKIFLISFERNSDTTILAKKLSSQHGIIGIVCKKYPFFGSLSLHPAISQLHTVLKKFSAFNLIARGPLAGYICLKASYKTACTSLKIQARGLLAEEYAYTYKNSRGLMYRLHRFRTRQFEALERSIYNAASPIIIEAVSPALKEYLIEHFHADPHAITIAHADIPPHVSPEQNAQWRMAMRAQLTIPDNAYVYCYNGSIKAWQCPEQVIAYFAHKYSKNKKSFLLILTQDKEQFETMMNKTSINRSAYLITTVPHTDMYRYLAACDAGLIFRESTIMNWISRPTKVLEYQAVGLHIIHNNTVALLHEKF